MGLRSITLQGLRLDVYRHILANPDCTRRDVAIGLDLPNNVATARIKELIDEGYVYETGERKRNPSGVMARVLRASDEPEDKKPVKRVRVAVAVSVDGNGKYIADAMVVDPAQRGDRKAGYGAPVAMKTVSVPLKFDTTTSVVSKAEIVDLPGDIIDAEYVVESDS